MQGLRHLKGFRITQKLISNGCWTRATLINSSCQKLCRNYAMEALQLDPKAKSVTHSTDKIEVPVVTKPDEVLVKMAYAGVCGTDLHVIEGTFPSSQNPVILGHEISGQICSLGKEVKHIKEGDKVAVDPYSSCGVCKFCRTGAYHLCPDGALNTTIGIFSDGGWAEYCKVPAKQAYTLPPSITVKQGVLLEPLSCIYHAYMQASPVHIGSSILIIGAGIIGILLSAMLHHKGHRNVMVAEPEESRREILKKLETGFKIVTPKELESICKEGIGGMDIIFDCSGCAKAMEQAVSILNRHGKLCIFGVAPPNSRVSEPPIEVFLREWKIFGATINPFTFHHAMGLMEAMGERYINYDRLGIKEYQLSQHKDAFETLNKKTISKPVFKIDKEQK